MSQPPAKPTPHWRRDIEGTDHGRTWAGVLAGVLVTFLALELPALGDKITGNTLSEAVWSVAQPFGAWWWILMPPFAGLCAWLVPHFSFRWGGAWHLLILVVVAYLISAAIYLIVR